MNNTPHVSVIIPAYNESRRIIPTIAAIISYMRQQKMSYEIVVVDDGSVDDTKDVVGNLDFPNVKLISFSENKGKGAAVKAGMLEATGRYLLFTDADNSTPIEELSNLLVYVDDYDVIVGSRRAKGATTANKKLVRHIVSWGLNLLVQVVLGIRVRDTQCGFKLFSYDVAKHLFNLQTIEGFSFDLEVLYLASKLEYQTIEVPVGWHDAFDSKVQPVRETRQFFEDLKKIRNTEYAHV